MWKLGKVTGHTWTKPSSEHSAMTHPVHLLLASKDWFAWAEEERNPIGGEGLGYGTTRFLEPIVEKKKIGLFTDTTSKKKIFVSENYSLREKVIDCKDKQKHAHVLHTTHLNLW